METKREIESSGRDVKEAIDAGLEALGLARDAVEVEVLDEGSRGLLGIGSRPARVRLTAKVEPKDPEPEPEPEPEIEDVVPSQAEAAEEMAPVEVPEAPRKEEALERSEAVAPPKEAPPAVDKEEQELWDAAPVARQTLEELLEEMEISADVQNYIKPAEDRDDYPKLVLNIQGQDLGILIGRRGETLNALEYLTRLIVGRELERRVNLIVDVEDYRVRREQSLRQLAKRMAERAMATGRRQVLEPMSPAERRIVHVTLRDHPDVATESIGRGDNRKVTIFMRGGG